MSIFLNFKIMNNYIYVYNNGSRSSHKFESCEDALNDAFNELKLMNKVSSSLKSIYVWQVLSNGCFSQIGIIEL